MSDPENAEGKGGGGNDGTLHLTRDIPVPRTISEQAQQWLRDAAPMVHERLANRGGFPALADHNAWKALIAQTDAYIVEMCKVRAEAFAVGWNLLELSGVPVYELLPEGADSGHDATVLYDIHGGALTSGGGEACRMMGTNSAARIGLRTFAVDYRMPPDHPYPASLDDCLSVYRALLERYPPGRIVVSGGSAGGNLAAALMLRAYDEGLPMPAALLLFTPECDLTEMGDTFDVLEGVDTVLVHRLSESIALYANGADLSHPYLSPVLGDVSHFPPTLVQAGTRDLFLSNSVRMHRALRAAGVDAELHVWEAMPHGGFGGAPEDLEVAIEARSFIAKHVVSTV